MKKNSAGLLTPAGERTYKLPSGTVAGSLCYLCDLGLVSRVPQLLSSPALMLGTRDSKLEHDFSMKKSDGGWDRAASCFLYWRRGKSLPDSSTFEGLTECWWRRVLGLLGLLFQHHTNNWMSVPQSWQSLIFFCSKTSSWILNFKLTFSIKSNEFG